MKTTLVIPDSLFRALKRRAAEEGETLSALIAGLLRQGLEAHSQRSKRLAPLPSFDMGKARVNIADRNELFDVLTPERDFRLYRRSRKA